MADIRITRNEHYWQQQEYLVEFTVTTSNRRQFSVQQNIPQHVIERHSEYELLDLAYLMMGLKLKDGIAHHEAINRGTVEVNVEGEPYRPDFFATMEDGSKIHINEDL